MNQAVRFVSSGRGYLGSMRTAPVENSLSRFHAGGEPKAGGGPKAAGGPVAVALVSVASPCRPRDVDRSGIGPSPSRMARRQLQDIAQKAALGRAARSNVGRVGDDQPGVLRLWAVLASCDRLRGVAGVPVARRAHVGLAASPGAECAAVLCLP